VLAQMAVKKVALSDQTVWNYKKKRKGLAAKGLSVFLINARLLLFFFFFF